jgi:hypothetical protein
MLGELEQIKQAAELEKLSKDKADEIEAFVTKGKAMIRESRQKAKALQLKITEEYEVKISSLEESLERVKSIQEEYEQKASAKISKRDHQIKLLEARNRESITANSQLEDKVKKAERSSKELAGENDRLRRQLGSRFGLGGSSQNHLEDLASVMTPNRSIFANDVQGSKSSSMDSSPLPSFVCSIGCEVMRDPVCCADGHSYERANIERWLATHNTSPRTGAELLTKALTPNHALRNAIEEWLSRDLNGIPLLPTELCCVLCIEEHEKVGSLTAMDINTMLRK